MNKIYIIPDVHCRNFYKPILQVKDTPIVFLGDYMDPYWWEHTNNEDGFANLEEVFDFAQNNKNVTLLAGNHDCSFIWSYMGFERTHYNFYNDLHKLYRDNINLLHPIHKINDVIFTHAGINAGWLNRLKDRVTQDTIISYIENEWNSELNYDKASIHHFRYDSLKSPIFDIGRYRGGDTSYGGPFWSDFYYDYHYHPEDWDFLQICGHQQGEITGQPRFKDGIVCLDSRAIFEYYPETHLVKPSEINDDKVKSQIPDYCMKGEILGFTDNSSEDIN